MKYIAKYERNINDDGEEELLCSVRPTPDIGSWVKMKWRIKLYEVWYVSIDSIWLRYYIFFKWLHLCNIYYATYYHFHNQPGLILVYDPPYGLHEIIHLYEQTINSLGSINYGKNYLLW